MHGAHATTRRLVAPIVVLAVMATGCATVPPTASPSPPAWEPLPYGQVELPLPDDVDSAQLTIEVRNLRDMAGLDLSIGLLLL